MLTGRRGILEYQNDKTFLHVADVRGKNGSEKGKLLFRLALGDQGLTILLKLKGEEGIYCIPLYVLLEPFYTELETSKRSTRFDAYIDNMHTEKNE